MPKKLNLDFARGLALEKGGVCLSTEYKNIRTQMMWQCNCDHIFTAPLRNLSEKGLWCPICNTTTKIIQRERLKNYVSKLGGKIISFGNTFDDVHTWECIAGHRWKSTPHTIKTGHWCRKCKQKQKKEKLNATKS